MIDADKKEVYTPGMNVVMANPYGYSGWHGYYGGSYGIYSTSGRSYNYLEINAETVVFDVKSDKPVWTVVTQTNEEKNKK